MTAVFFKDDKHGDVGLARIIFIDGTDDASYWDISEIGHDS